MSTEEICCAPSSEKKFSPYSFSLKNWSASRGTPSTEKTLSKAPTPGKNHWRPIVAVWEKSTPIALAPHRNITAAVSKPIVMLHAGRTQFIAVFTRGLPSELRSRQLGEAVPSIACAASRYGPALNEAQGGSSGPLT